jgi:hypothetical protein
MDETGGLEGGDPAEPPHAAPPPADLPRVVDIAEAGNLVLDLVFESPRSSSSSISSTLKPTRKALTKTAAPSHRSAVPGAGAPAAASSFKGRGRSRVGFRVDLAVLRRQSPYFNTLLSDTRFAEARAVASTLAALSLGGAETTTTTTTTTQTKLSSSAAAAVPAADLPWVRIVDEDVAATRQPAAVREAALADMLRVLHGRPAATAAPTMGFVVALAVLADRFDCAAAASKIMVPGWKLKWPVTQRRVPAAAAGDDYPRMSRAVEDMLRQKILVAWLLNQPTRFQAATRELIMNGSCKWTSFPEQDDGEDGPVEATWWNLQDGLERKLCVLFISSSSRNTSLMMYGSEP